jgi:hypothetical protein
MAEMVFLRSPQGDEIKEVEATAEKLSPWMSSGWHQVPAPAAAQKPAGETEEEKQHGEHQ